MQVRLHAALLSFLLVACGTRSKAEPPQSGNQPVRQEASASPQQALENLRLHIAQLEARHEHSEPKVVVQHILIGLAGTELGPKVTRTRAEAEQLTAEIWARVEAGDDFDTLVRQYTDDAHPGIYTMKADLSTVRRPEFGRAEMVPVFGNVGWRLKVGEAGVGGYDPVKSKYGWHIVKRIE